MWIFLVILFIAIIFYAAWWLAIGIVAKRNKAKKQATEMLKSGIQDEEKAIKLLKVLATCQDNEGKRLYTKLADLIEANSV